MKTLKKLVIVELKLLLRDPITLIFTLALPLLMLVAMGEVFGKAPSDPNSFSGVVAMNYYTPGYVGLVMLSIATVALPVHLAGYRERGVMRRLYASSLPSRTFFLAQTVVFLLVSILCSVILAVPAVLGYGAELPVAPGLLIGAFFLCLLSLAAFGIFLGAALPTARAAQGVGMPLFFIMFIISGTAPPREVMTEPMQRLGEAMPLWHVVSLMKDVWLEGKWDTGASLAVAGVLVGSTALAALIWHRK